MRMGDTVLALDIGGTQVRAGLVRGEQLLASRAQPWQAVGLPTDELHSIAALARELISAFGGDEPVRAAGVALAAYVDRAGQVVQWPNRPSWQGLAVQRLLADALQLPVVIEDDANAAALAEATCGAGRPYHSVLVMMVGTGVGAGLILQRQLWRGAHGWAGELGHQMVRADGPQCSCGLRGCLQMLASGRALERVAVHHGLPSTQALVELADTGETWAVQALTECGRWLGLAAANVVNLLDVEAVIVGGGLSGVGLVWSSLESTLAASILNAPHRTLMLHRAELPETAGLLGAGLLARQALAALPTTES